MVRFRTSARRGYGGAWSEPYATRWKFCCLSAHWPAWTCTHWGDQRWRQSRNGRDLSFVFLRNCDGQRKLRGFSCPTRARAFGGRKRTDGGNRWEEHTSAPQSLIRISYAVCCLKKK